MRRSRAAPTLPAATQHFLQTSLGKRARHEVYAFHRWLEFRRLPLGELTPPLFQYFLLAPQHRKVASKTSRRYWNRLRDYLYWLGEHGLLGFDAKHLRRTSRLLPPLAREFVASLAPTLRRSTQQDYVIALRKFHGWLDERGLRLRTLTRRQIAFWFQELHAAGLAPVTRLAMVLHVRVYLRWVHERRRMRTDPDDLVRPSDLPKLPVYLPRPLTVEADRELQRRLLASDDPNAWALLLMRRTGLRISELLGLEFHCCRIDQHRPLLKVPLGKMNNERLVPLDPDAVELVHRLQSVGSLPRPRLVPGRSSDQQNYWTLTRVLTAASSGLPDPVRITSHRLRHTYATELINAGMSLVGVMRLLGHRDHRMTLRYASITPETIGDEYHKALARLAERYRIPPTLQPRGADATEPDQLLEHLARWARKYARAPRAPRDLLRRIERLRRAVQELTTTAEK